MRRMDEIIAKVAPKEVDATHRWLDSKTGWINYHYDEERQSSFSKIKDFIQGDVQATIVDVSRSKITMVKSKGEISPWRTEEALERVIRIVNKEIAQNQFSVDAENPKEAVDLVISEGKAKLFVELKPWRSGDNPLFAMIESFKNYCLARDQSVKGLMLLAPREYFIEYYDKNSVGEFLKTVEDFRTTWKIDFDIKFIDGLSEEIFNRGLADKTTTEWRITDPKATKQYEESQVIDLSAFNWDEFHKYLHISSWVPINNEKDWPQK